MTDYGFAICILLAEDFCINAVLWRILPQRRFHRFWADDLSLLGSE